MTDEPTLEEKPLATGPVWSTNEWDPLREVIVGSVQGAIYPDYGPIAAANGDPTWLQHYQGAFVEQDLIDLAEEQLAGFVDTLQAEGVVVRRPDPLPHNIPIETPFWRARGGWNTANPRDLFLVVGDRVVECATPQRHRTWERMAYRRLLDRWWRAGARWDSAPPPALHESLYDHRAQRRRLAGGDVAPSADGRSDGHQVGTLAPGEEPLWPINEEEPVWEAADFVRCDEQIFVTRSTVTNRAGIEWVRRHLAADARVVEIASRCAAPHHLDTTFVPLRPGIALVHPEWFVTPAALESWTLIPAPAPSYAEDSPMASPYFTSQWLSMNVLSLDRSRVFVDAGQLALARLLESHGFEPILLPFDAMGAFGGSFHCATLDVRRG